MCNQKWLQKRKKKNIYACGRGGVHGAKWKCQCFQAAIKEICLLSPNWTNLCVVFLVPLLSKQCPAGLCCCHSLSPSLSAAVVVSIIHHLHSQAIYTTFYSQSAFTLCCLHLSTAIQIFRPVWAVLGRPATSGPEKCIRWLPHINKCVANKSFFFSFFFNALPHPFWNEVKSSFLSQVNHNLWQPIKSNIKRFLHLLSKAGATAAHTHTVQSIRRPLKRQQVQSLSWLWRLAAARHVPRVISLVWGARVHFGFVHWKRKRLRHSHKLACFVSELKTIKCWWHYLRTVAAANMTDRLAASQSSRLTSFLCHVGRVNREWTDYAL